MCAEIPTFLILRNLCLSGSVRIGRSRTAEEVEELVEATVAWAEEDV